MAYSVEKISDYLIYYMGHSTISHDAEIDLFYKGKRVGILYFYREGKEILEDGMTVNGVYLHFQLYRFDSILHILQSEKPIFIWYDKESRTGNLSTSREKVGEEESA